MTEDMEPPEVTVQLADRLKVTVTGGSGDDLEEVSDTAYSQLTDALEASAAIEEMRSRETDPGIQ